MTNCPHCNTPALKHPDNDCLRRWCAVLAQWKLIIRGWIVYLEREETSIRCGVAIGLLENIHQRAYYHAPDYPHDIAAAWELSKLVPPAKWSQFVDAVICQLPRTLAISLGKLLMIEDAPAVLCRAFCAVKGGQDAESP